MKYMRRGSGYYIDIGASQLIIDGKIKLVSGQVEEITPKGVKLDNGKELPADVIVYATGYSSMNGWVADICGQEMADKVGKVWGLGSNTKKDPGPWEGEPRNMWKPTQQEALWFHGGNLHQSRHYSQFLALQLKARLEGIPTPVYGLQEVHHKADARGIRSGQPHGRRRETGDAFAAPGKAELLARRRLDRDAADIEAGDLGDTAAHRLAVRADLRRFADERRVEMDDRAAARTHTFGRMGEEHLRRRALPLRVRRREMLADVALGERAIDRVGKRVQADVGVGMAAERGGVGDAHAA